MPNVIAGHTHPYEALSYVWGRPEKTCLISVQSGSQGYKLPITSNLEKALLQLRYSSLEQIIWIDAVCINQDDDREKERQIQIMYKIYSCARCVVVWLGEEAEDSDQKLEALRIIAGKRAAASLGIEARGRHTPTH
jgi:hypothetical protein